jgi:hypothetical protein
MSWKSIAINQTISRANLQDAITTGVFVVKNGVPVTETNRQITKANAQDYIYTWDLYPPFRDKASNQLPVKGDLAVQSMQIFGTTNGSTNSGFIFIGNNNRNWFIKILFVGATGNIMGVASSTNGQYMLVGKYYANGSSNGGSAVISYNYGETFASLNGVIGSGDSVNGVAMSDAGQYMVMTRQKGSVGGAVTMVIFKSSDYGLSWTNTYNTAGVEYYVSGAAMSGNGTYFSVLGYNNIGASTSYYVFHSSGGAVTQTLLNLGATDNSSPAGGCIDMSNSGQYQLASPPYPRNPSLVFLNIFFLSTNYGVTWATIAAPSTLYTITKFTGCTVSATGDYMSVSCTSSAGGYIFTSSDFGSTWSTVVFGSPGPAIVTSDKSGQFQYASFSGNLISSESYGQTPWNTSTFSDGTLYGISVAPITGTTPYIYALLNSVSVPKYTKTTGLAGALYNDVSGLTAGLYYNSIATSGNDNNGKYVITSLDVISPSTSRLYLSTDYGNIWVSRISLTGSEKITCCAISDDGVYILAVVYNTSTDTDPKIYVSINSGRTFTSTAPILGGFPIGCSMSADGKYSTILFNGPYLYTYNSANFLSSFSVGYTSSTIVGGDIAVSRVGIYRTIGGRNTSSNSVILYSSNYGVAWTTIVLGAGIYPIKYCSCDNSGQVCIAAGNNISGASFGVLYYTTDFWATYSSYSVASSQIGGVNVSNDATYWTFVTTDGYSYVSTDKGSTWAITNLGSTYTFKQLSK